MNCKVRTVVIDGATRMCPQGRGTLVFASRHPILTVGMTLERSGVERGDRIGYEQAWVCRSDRCDYRELVGEA